MNGVCHQCGTQIELSLREPMLSEAPTEYLKKVTGGLSLILNAILLSFLLGLVWVIAFVAVVGIGSPGSQPRTPPVGLTASMTLGDIAIVCISLVGYWRFSAPDPSPDGFEKSSTARKVIRAMVQLQVVLTVISGLFNVYVYSTPGAAPAAMPGFTTTTGLVLLAMNIVGCVLLAVKFFAVMQHTRWLASRVPDPYIVNRTRTYMWQLPVLSTVGIVLIGLGPLIALIMYWNLLDRLRKHMKALSATGQPAIV
jgi:hypothetical protein